MESKFGKNVNDKHRYTRLYRGVGSDFLGNGKKG